MWKSPLFVKEKGRHGGKNIRQSRKIFSCGWFGNNLVSNSNRCNVMLTMAKKSKNFSPAILVAPNTQRFSAFWLVWCISGRVCSSLRPDSIYECVHLFFSSIFSKISLLTFSWGIFGDWEWPNSIRKHLIDWLWFVVCRLRFVFFPKRFAILPL